MCLTSNDTSRYAIDSVRPAVSSVPGRKGSICREICRERKSRCVEITIYRHQPFVCAKLPEVFVALVKAQNSKSYELGRSNYSLSDHIKGRLAQQAIVGQGQWDVVILQEQSSKDYKNVEDCNTRGKIHSLR